MSAFQETGYVYLLNENITTSSSATFNKLLVQGDDTELVKFTNSDGSTTYFNLDSDNGIITLSPTSTVISGSGLNISASSTLSSDLYLTGLTSSSATNVLHYNSSTGKVSYGLGLSEFSDALFRVYNSLDNTKKISLDCSLISNATTRTLTLPDSNCVPISKSGTTLTYDSNSITDNVMYGQISIGTSTLATNTIIGGTLTVNGSSTDILSSSVKLSGIGSSSTANILYYDSSSKLVTYSALPSTVYTFLDNLFEIYNNSDPTKILMFNLANQGTGSTKTVNTINHDSILTAYTSSNLLAGRTTWPLTSGDFNTCFGQQSLIGLTSGARNSAFGYRSNASGSSSDNSCFGYQSGYALTSGQQNTFVGSGAGVSCSSGSNNIALGYNADIGAGVSNTCNIGNSSIANTFLYGNVGIGDTSPLCKLAVGPGSLNDSAVPVQISANGNLSYFGVNRTNGAYGALFGWQSAYGVAVRSVSASDNLSFIVSNTNQAMTINPNGCVGIGTTSFPGTAYRLNVFNTGASTYFRISGDVANQQAIEFYDSTSRWVMYKPGSSTDLRLYNGSSDKFVFTSGGALGVNTTTVGSFNLRVNGYTHLGDDYDPTQYGLVQITRPANQGSAHHMTFIRAGVIVAGIGFRNNSNLFQIVNGPGTNAGTTGIIMDSNGNCGFSNTPVSTAKIYAYSTTAGVDGVVPQIDPTGSGESQIVLTSSNNTWLRMATRSAAGSFNPLVQSSGARFTYATANATDSGNLFIGPWTGTGGRGCLFNSSGQFGIGLLPTELLHMYGDGRNAIHKFERSNNTSYDACTLYYNQGTIGATNPYFRVGLQAGNVDFVINCANPTEQIVFRITFSKVIYFPLLANGTLQISGGAVISTSDSRIKNTIEYFTEPSLPKIMELKPCSYYTMYDEFNKREGFIAQDVEQHLPHAVDGKKYEYEIKTDSAGNTLLNEDGTPQLDMERPRYRGLDTTSIIAHLVKAVQELKVQLDVALDRITMLESS